MIEKTKNLLYYDVVDSISKKLKEEKEIEREREGERNRGREKEKEWERGRQEGGVRGSYRKREEREEI